jgi:hypothetical protein
MHNYCPYLPLLYICVIGYLDMAFKIFFALYMAALLFVLLYHIIVVYK